MQLPQLKRIRWAVRAALFLGVAASVAANVLHADDNVISQTISAWPPLALLLTVELTSRIPMHRPMLAGVRVLATIVIAGIAAWVSYWHMREVAVTYGETEISAYLLPISVDGLIVVASVSLVELAGRIRMLEDARAKAAPAPAGPGGRAGAVRPADAHRPFRSRQPRSRSARSGRPGHGGPGRRGRPMTRTSSIAESDETDDVPATVAAGHRAGRRGPRADLAAERPSAGPEHPGQPGRAARPGRCRPTSTAPPRPARR